MGQDSLSAKDLQILQYNLLQTDMLLKKKSNIYLLYFDIYLQITFIAHQFISFL
jgi:hypothetical protein